MAIPEMILTAALALAAVETVRNVVSATDYIDNHLIFESQSATVARQHNAKYSLHKTDKQYIASSQHVLHEVLGHNPTEYLLGMEAEERISAMQSLTSKLSKIYALDDIRIELEYGDALSMCGCYSKKEHKITLNYAHLLTTNADVTKEFLDTIFHEFRHAVQWKMVADDGYIWYNDKKAVGQIAYNLMPEHYISFHENPRAYYYQYVEMDAHEIAMCILEEHHA